MIDDLTADTGRSAPPAVVAQADARSFPLPDASVAITITSPPYANRHDYSRAYAIELAVAPPTKTTFGSSAANRYTAIPKN